LKLQGEQMNNQEQTTHVDSQQINHLSLCAGYGGFDIGLQSVLPACRTVAYVEIEAFAIANLVAKMEAGRLDDAPVYTDVRSFPYRSFHGLVDIITGGFPCQPFSIAGKRAGVDDERHLWPAIARGISECRPAVVFLENVDGIATAKSPGYHSVLHHVISDLEGMGFRATAGCFTAAEVGATHLRKRWFILAVADTSSTRFPHWLPGQEQRQEGHTGKPGNSCSQFDQGWQGIASTQQGAAVWSMAERSTIQYDTCNDECELGFCPRHGICIEECDDCSESDLQHRHEHPNSNTHWPAGPGQQQHEWEEPRVAVSGLGGASNGPSSRVDRLRLLGNGVVPATCAKAFVTLMNRLNNQEQA